MSLIPKYWKWPQQSSQQLSKRYTGSSTVPTATCRCLLTRSRPTPSPTLSSKYLTRRSMHKAPSEWPPRTRERRCKWIHVSSSASDNDNSRSCFRHRGQKHDCSRATDRESSRQTNWEHRPPPRMPVKPAMPPGMTTNPNLQRAMNDHLTTGNSTKGTNSRGAPEVSDGRGRSK